MLIAIRADASSIIGVGHVARCMALADALKEVGARVLLLTRDLGVDVTRLTSNSDVTVEVMPRPQSSAPVQDSSVPYAHWAQVGWETDVDECSAVLERYRPQWVVVDHYSFDERWHREISRRTGARIAVIDDLGDRALSADVVVDQNPSSNHAAKFAGRLKPAARLLGGPRYALLKRRFRCAQPIEIKPEVASIGIFMGGTDPTNLSEIALRACREQAGFDGPIEVVTTRGNGRLDDLAELTRKWPRTQMRLDLDDLVGFFSSHDIQIGAGGTASWERCSLGVPTIGLTAADNQRMVLPELQTRGAALVLDQADSHDVVRVGAAIRALLSDRAARMNLSRRSRELVDGLGAIRVALTLCADELQVRAASAADSQRMYSWRNDPATREVSRDTSVIAPSDHERWFQAALQSEERVLLIAHVGDVDVGVVRFDRNGEDRAEVSIYLDPALHGLGLGRSALLAAERFVSQRDWPLRELTADVIATNQASQRLFAACGYQWSQERWRKRLDATRLER